MKKNYKRFFIYCLGLYIMSFGISLSIISNLGVSPVSSVPYITSRILNIDMGLCTATIYIIFIIGQYILIPKDFKMSNFMQLLSSVILGTFISLNNRLTSYINLNNNYTLQIVFCLISICLVSLSVVIYLSPNLLSLSSEGLTLVIAKRFNLELYKAKMIFDVVLVSCSMLASYICLQGIVGIREGTLMAAFGIGYLIKPITKIVQPTLKKFLE